MSETCSDKVYNRSRSFGSQWDACGRPAKVTHEGRHYCGIHDPVKKAAKDKARRDEWEATSLANAKHRRLEGAAQDLLEALAPFAALLASHHERMPDNQPIFGINSATFTVGDMRKAVAAIAKATGSK